MYFYKLRDIVFNTPNVTGGEYNLPLLLLLLLLNIGIKLYCKPWPHPGQLAPLLVPCPGQKRTRAVARRLSGINSLYIITTTAHTDYSLPLN